jgi:hypothetical protein
VCWAENEFIYSELPPIRQQTVSEYNNAVTAKYISYCERLEYWLFEDNGIIKKRNIKNRKVVVRYAVDFLNDPSLPVELKNDIQDLITFRDKIFEEEKQKIANDPVNEVQRRIYELYLKHYSHKKEEKNECEVNEEKLQDEVKGAIGKEAENTNQLQEKLKIELSVTLNKYKKLKRGSEMANRQTSEATRLLKSELKEIRNRIKELEDVLYEYESLADDIEEDLENLKSDTEIIPEEYVFTGEGKQVFRDIYLKKGLYEIEAESEGDRTISIKAKTKSSTPLLARIKKKGKCLEHIEKSRIYHIEIDLDAEWKVIFRLIER